MANAVPSLFVALSTKDGPMEIFLTLLILERGREGEEGRGGRERNIDSLFHLCTHWLVFLCALMGNRTHNLSILGQHSKYLSTRPGQMEISNECLM